MAVERLAGAEFSGLVHGTADAAGGYVIGFSPGIAEMLHIDAARPTRLIGMKFSEHKLAGEDRRDRRHEMRPPETDDVLFTMLVGGGPWNQRLWREHTMDTVTLRLRQPGDFIAWEPGIAHMWYPEGDASMVTIRFTRSF